MKSIIKGRSEEWSRDMHRRFRRSRRNARKSLYRKMMNKRLRKFHKLYPPRGNDLFW